MFGRYCLIAACQNQAGCCFVKTPVTLLPTGHDGKVVEQIYPSQSLFTVYVHSFPNHVEKKSTIFLGREVPGRVTTTYASHSLIKVRTDGLQCFNPQGFEVSMPFFSGGGQVLLPSHHMKSTPFCTVPGEG